MDLFSFFRSRPTLPPLRFRNTLSGVLEEFTPLSHTVKMYNCGPTVYDFVHIGNLRSYVFADTIRRTLEYWGYPLLQVINITDFGHLVSDADEGEDKMTKGLKREGLALTMQNMRTLAEKYTDAFLADIEAVGIHTKKIKFPRASDYIPEQIALIKALEQKGYAYKTDDGMYFETSKFPNYGKLGKRAPMEQREGTRVTHTVGKKNTNDFALWKFDTRLGWDSPWGKGFPGWHIECTAMIFTLLGKQIDIHTGGIDHISIHHNNEIAQAESITGKQFVRYWMHNEFITIEAKRVGKSEGNAILLKSVADRGVSPCALRYWFLTGHYRTQMNFTWEALEGANSALRRLMQAYVEAPKGALDKDFMAQFYAAIANDLDTPRALALVWENIKTLNRATLTEVDKILGLLESGVQKEVLIVPLDVQNLVKDREEARAQRDFARSDALRAQIEEMGFEVSDSSEGPKIRKKS